MANEIYDIVFKATGYDKIENAVKSIENAFGKVDVQIQKVDKNSARVGDDMAKDMKKASKGVQNTNQQLKTMGDLMKLELATKFAYGVKNAFGSMISSVKSFSEAQGQVNTLLDGTGTSVDEVMTQLKKVPPMIGNMTDLSKAAYQAISASVDPRKIGDFIATAGKASVAGATDIETAVNGLTSVINAYHLSTKDASKVSDVFFSTIKAGKTTFSELNASIGQVLPTAAQMGVNFETVGGAIAEMTKQGIGTSEAITSLNAVLRSLAKNGLTSMVKTKGLTVAINELRTRAEAGAKDAGGFESSLLKLTGRAEAAKAIFALTGQNINDFNNILNQTANSAGATKDAFGKMKNETSAGIAELVNSWENLKITFGEAIAPALDPIIKSISSAVQWFGSLNNITKEFIVAFSGITALAVVLTPLIKSFTILKDTIMATKLAAVAAEEGIVAMFSAAVVPAVLIAGFFSWIQVINHLDDVILGLKQSFIEAYNWLMRLVGLQSRSGNNVPKHKWTESELQAAGKINGSFYSGGNVPSNGVYYLHGGETVLNRQAVMGDKGGNSVHININNPSFDSRGRVEQLVNRINANFTTRRKEYLGV